ncbi:hypothetical protein MASR1M90_15840 [Desulfovibrionales bacterium]
MVTFKLGSIIFAIGLYFGFFVFGPGYGAMTAQGLLLALLLVGNTWRNGWASTYSACATFLPFVLFLLFFGLLFDWIALLGREDWLADSVHKAVVFPNSFLVMKLGLECVSFQDILAMPISPGARRTCILFRTVMEHCAPLVHRHRFFMDISPHFDHQRGAMLKKLTATLVAAYVSIYRHAEKTQALLDHRQQYVGKNR